jgi:ABC-2 type transport system ATP-binding protein
VEPVIELSKVVKRFGSHVAVDGLDLVVPRGSIYGFLGPNGAGKTTTLRMIMSILVPDSGTVRVLGHPSPEAVKDRLGYLPEEKGLYKKMKAAEIVAYFGRLKGLDAATAKRRANEMLEQYGLGDSRNTRCEALSKGMGQKVQVLGTLVHQPELVILDEPFSGLDPMNAQVLKDLVLDIPKTGRTVIFSTHVMEHAEQLCDQLVIIAKGRKVREGTVSDLKRMEEPSVVVEHEGDVSFQAPLHGVHALFNHGRLKHAF